MMRVCHLNTCPAGVATQDPKLRERFAGAPEHVVNFMHFIAQDLREIMAQLGFRTLNEMVGRVDRLEPRKAIAHWKARGFDFSNILYQPDLGPEIGRYCTDTQDHGLEKSLDVTTLLDLCKPAIERGEAVQATVNIRNVNRVVGTITGSAITRRWGAKGLPRGHGAAAVQGLGGTELRRVHAAGHDLPARRRCQRLRGQGAVGRTDHRQSRHRPRPSCRKTTSSSATWRLYGATAGEAYFRGMAGERFAVRNSGVRTVVEGVGDHGCEYMTGGRVVVLGRTGRNFAAGMSGGVAYVLDEAGDCRSHINKQMVAVTGVDGRGGHRGAARPDRAALAAHAQRPCAAAAGFVGHQRREVREGHAEGLPARARLHQEGARPGSDGGRGHHGRVRRKRARPRARWRELSFNMGKPTGFIEYLRELPVDRTPAGAHPGLA